MTHTDYTKNILNIKDENIYFDENCFEKKEDYVNQPICIQINLYFEVNNEHIEEINYIKGQNYNAKYVDNIVIYEFNIAEYKKM